jgi:hypothetical protein
MGTQMQGGITIQHISNWMIYGGYQGYSRVADKSRTSNSFISSGYPAKLVDASIFCLGRGFQVNDIFQINGFIGMAYDKVQLPYNYRYIPAGWFSSGGWNWDFENHDVLGGYTSVEAFLILSRWLGLNLLVNYNYNRYCPALNVGGGLVVGYLRGRK